MSLFRSMMSANFRVNERGETTFFYPALGGLWRTRHGYRITSNEDILKLKRFLSIQLAIGFFGIIPIVLITIIRFRDAIDVPLPLFLLCCMVVVVVFTNVFERVFLRKIIDKYEKTGEKLNYRDVQRVYVESVSWTSLVVWGVVCFSCVIFGLFAIFSGFAVEGGITIEIGFGSAGAQVAYQIVLKRQGKAQPDRR